MEDFHWIQSLVGESVTEEELKYVDCYVNRNLGLFIPSTGKCLYAARPFHVHPSYMFIIAFGYDKDKVKPTIDIKEDHYLAFALSPDIPHTDEEGMLKHYYCLLIDKEYFEEQYKMYTNEEPYFNWTQFAVCHDILKILNTFAFEYSKKMMNSDITLQAQSTIITHWLIRSILGEAYDLRAISSNYAVARAEHYIEQHYSEPITVKRLAEIGNISVSGFNRIFKKETKLSPIEYLIQVRLEKSKKLLIRKEIPITEIALRCGFSSSSHYSSCFHKRYNVTPSEYRNSYS
ncbi:helix-turn-helix transcriptional regulator [Lachnospiraceae bacterium MD1]|jgi:AraC-like DNA-binding protein|uniref:Helix-turn-helix transcriptional regulator n=1 Tax=Variimorphobacter saccharofermentans TaxID=2755051 RepID=A0A839JYR1_9FIRM|nr:AraC family transcriptional regulator [Variimorphobacter saccharofermentans]MBB2182526.1 helix-turn-helix transcriptional regulator [Variimorphobacter saccharofermentans]